MTGMPTPKIDTEVVGRHGRIGKEIFPRDFEIPSYDEDFTRAALGVVGAAQLVEQPSTKQARPMVEAPLERPGMYL